MKYLTTEKIPVWAVYYLEYGDPSGLDDEDIELVDEFISDNFERGFVMDFPTGASSYFTSHPAFGKACEVYDIDFYEA